MNAFELNLSQANKSIHSAIVILSYQLSDFKMSLFFPAFVVFFHPGQKKAPQFSATQGKYCGTCAVDQHWDFVAGREVTGLLGRQTGLESERQKNEKFAEQTA